MKRAIYVGLICIIIVAALMVALLQRQSPDKMSASVEAGICVHTLTVQDAALVSESGARWIRIDISNNETDTTNSLINAKNYNLSVLGILGSWMFNQSCNFTLNDWERAVSSNVSKYAPYVDAWEIWNEPTSPSYPLLDLNITNADVERNMATIVDFYFNMSKTASTIIHKNDPNTTILLLGGMNLYSAGDPNFELDWNFSSQLADRGIGQYGDAISLHAYPWTNDSTTNFLVNYSDALIRYQKLFPSHELWVTETGQKLNNSNEVIQAGYLNQAFNFFKGQADTVFWYALHDDHFNDGVDYFGLVDDNMQPREAYYALQDSLR
jgi:hypothetical protein